MAGALGALMAEKGSAIAGLGDGKAIGFVVAGDLPVIRDFLAGYIQGASYPCARRPNRCCFRGHFRRSGEGQRAYHGALWPGR